MTREEKNAPAQPLDDIPEENESPHVEEVPPAPTPAKRSRSEEGGEEGEQDNAEAEVELLLDDKALEQEFHQEEDKNKNSSVSAKPTGDTHAQPTETQLRLLELAQSLQPPPLTPEQAEAAVAAEDAMEVDAPPPRRVPPPPKRPPVPLFSVSPPSNHHLTGANTTPVGPTPPNVGPTLVGRLGSSGRPPLATRLGFPPSATAGGGEEGDGRQPLAARLGFVPSNNQTTSAGGGHPLPTLWPPRRPLPPFPQPRRC